MYRYIYYITCASLLNLISMFNSEAAEQGSTNSNQKWGDTSSYDVALPLLTHTKNI